MSQSVCFTGKGYHDGKLVPRVEWEDAARRIGWEPSPTVAPRGGILVASRDDTSKALAARQRGASIMSYDEFAGELLMAGISFVGNVPLVSIAVQERRYDQARRDAEEAAQAQRQFNKKREDEAKQDELEANPLWGSF